jgi:2-hydroxychromene-2-carboxylate isomerase
MPVVRTHRPAAALRSDGGGLFPKSRRCRQVHGSWTTSRPSRAWAGFIRRALSANFAEDREISEASVVGELLGELGQDGTAVIEEATSEAWKSRLRATTERAIGLGIFGAPTFMVGEEMFWGNDRLEQALDLAAREGSGESTR